MLYHRIDSIVSLVKRHLKPIQSSLHDETNVYNNSMYYLRASLKVARGRKMLIS